MPNEQNILRWYFEKIRDGRCFFRMIVYAESGNTEIVDIFGAVKGSVCGFGNEA